jgi:hypothetical protein
MFTLFCTSNVIANFVHFNHILCMVTDFRKGYIYFNFFLYVDGNVKSQMRANVIALILLSWDCHIYW